MKKVFSLIILLLLASQVFSQSGQIKCIAYKQNFRYSGEWGKWPNHWTTYESERRSKPVIRVTTINEGNYYRLQMFIDGNVTADFQVTYDSKLSAKKRLEWDDEYVNCYKDPNGDYVYTQGVSLKQLASNPTAWVDVKDSRIYLWVFSEDFAVLLK